jgi:hypothetical protein
VRPDTPLGAPPFTIWVVHDPRYAEPLVVAASPDLPAPVVLALYLDRWSVEQLPLVAKQLIGAGQQFVHAAETCQRLPELALLAGAVLSCMAATGPALPRGGWDRRPRRTPGRLRRVRAQGDFRTTGRCRRGFVEERRPQGTCAPARPAGSFRTAAPRLARRAPTAAPPTPVSGN